MIILITFLQAIVTLFDMMISIYIWVIIISSIISWVNADRNNPIVQLLIRLSELSYTIIRRYIPTIFGGIDLAPFIVILILQFLNLFVVKLLYIFINNLN
jgi:YggT family protein